MQQDVYEVVGGSEKGGIIVRDGKKQSSKEQSERLSKGARIKVVEKAADRIRYELLSGEGPQSGWVSSQLKGKELLKHLDLDKMEQEQILPAPLDPAQALKLYGEHFADNAQESLFGFNATSFATFPSCSRKVAAKTGGQEDHLVCAQLEKDLGLSKKKLALSSFGLRRLDFAADFGKDLDGEQLQLCHHCSLPLGESFYKREDENCLHGECLAQVMVHDMRKDDETRLQAEREQKNKRHEEYSIGWNVELIPRNDSAAKKLAMRDVVQGMVCIVLDEETQGLGVASTLEPAAAVNLEYLSTALEVRRREGHEPVFSLDPVSTEPNAMQAKRFVPEWLAGTSAGDVLFQSDYHLKELSMGEYDQPVVGMKSCFDYSEMEQMKSEWSAREWFMVRKAEVHISGNGVLRPFVKMGVEAREQVSKGSSMQDKQITRPDHPMVMYAEAFTKNFDLIAERKSVVYHLRELAKASVLAKYLLDTHVQLEDSWFALANGKEAPCSLEVPQLWNERISARVDVEGGVLTNEQNSRMHGVYGGVQFGLDKFNLSTSVSRAPGASLSAGMPQHRLAFGLSRRAGLAPVSNIMSMASGAQFAPPSAAIGATSLTGAMRLATSIGVSPLRAGLAPPSAALSATIAPRLATSVSASIGVTPRLASSIGASMGGGPRLATSIGASIGLAPRLATSIGASIGAAPRLSTSISASMGAVPHRLAAQIGAAPRLATSMIAGPPGRLQGVDLRLDNFDLSEAKRISPEAQEGSWSGELKSLDDCVAVGEIFWSSLESDSKIFKDEDRTLLREIFSSKLTDRRSEGDLFSPPDASHTYVTKLRALVKEEESVRQRRRTNFSSKTFNMEEPGFLFPSSWKSSFETSSSEEQRLRSTLVARPEYKDQAAEILQDALQDSSPMFEKSTEEGLCFRIYTLGSLEVRSIQEVESEELVVAVFSIKKPEPAGAVQGNKKVPDQEKVVKATQYVERTLGSVSLAAPGAQHHYYVVLETENGNKIRFERLSTGKLAWESGAEDLEDRNSLAKVMHSGKCKPGLLVGDMKSFQNTLAKGNAMVQDLRAPTAALASCKRHAKSMFAHATGAAPPALPVAPRPVDSFRPPTIMHNFMTPHARNQKASLFPKKLAKV